MHDISVGERSLLYSMGVSKCRLGFFVHFPRKLVDKWDFVGYAVGMSKTDYALGTYLEYRMPWGTFSGGRVRCPDGKVRALSRISMTADTFFSIPAAVKALGKTVSGYVTFRTLSGLSSGTVDDPVVAEFVPYEYRKNHDVFP